MHKKLLSSTGLLIALALLLAVNVLAGATLGGARFDLTANKIYTLSPGAKNLLADMQEPVTLRFYFSRKLAADVPPIRTYAQRVEELLREFESLSKGKINLEVADPEPFSEIEDRAVGYGLRGVQMGEGELLYFGLVGTNSTDEQELIPFFQPDKEEFLEYDLAKLVYTLSSPRKQTLGVISTLPIEGEAPNVYNPRAERAAPWFFHDQIRKIYTVQNILPNAEEIPEEVDLLMIVHPKELPEKLLYAVDQFVLGGGRVLAFVDPYCQADQPPTDPSNPMSALMAPRASNLDKLFEAWGLRMKKDQIAGDRSSSIKITTNNRGREEAVDCVVYLSLAEGRLAKDEVVTSRLGDVKMGLAGILEPIEGATTAFTPLIQTSEESADIATTEVQFGLDPVNLLSNFFADGKPRTVMARVAGPAKSAFPEGKPVGENEEEPSMVTPPEEGEKLHKTESDGAISVIVVADADLLADRFWVQVQNLGNMRLGIPFADNGGLVANALEFLQGSTDLISLRGRSGARRPFKVVDELERDAEQRFRSEAQRLEQELERADQRINELQSEKADGSSLILSPEQQAEIERIREEQVKTRKELRNVRHELRKDIERLGTKLKFLNIMAIPALIAILAVGLGTYKHNRRRSA